MTKNMKRILFLTCVLAVGIFVGMQIWKPEQPAQTQAASEPVAEAVKQEAHVVVQIDQEQPASEPQPVVVVDPIKESRDKQLAEMGFDPNAGHKFSAVTVQRSNLKQSN